MEKERYTKLLDDIKNINVILEETLNLLFTLEDNLNNYCSIDDLAFQYELIDSNKTLMSNILSKNKGQVIEGINDKIALSELNI